MSSEETIFAEARGITSPDARSAYLEQACGGDAALRREVEALLAAHEQAAGFMQSPAPALGATAAADSSGSFPTTTVASEPVGATVGPYKLLEHIGEGGMGVVYMADQVSPVRRRVALKIIKPGMDSRQVIARFEAERQALAMMDHPGIARVLDAGTTDAGRPYFAMELVRGVPITAYCDANNLTPRERLGLFVQVCQAVQHAHTKGIIHRDLKPTNILVTLHDGVPVPKVIDFGIAKATGGAALHLTDKTLFTHFAQMVGTPLYMSPEQAEFSGLDVDTRSDVYSLGVLLYELLTGTTPFDRKRLSDAALDEVRRIIREEDPPRPSTRLSTLLGETLTAVSARRRTDPGKLGRSFRGELDWIVMKSLEKDRVRRYETVSAFAADVQRHLDDQPVEACPPSASYRLRKFARRNKPVLVSAGLVASALLIGTAVSTWQAVRATRAEGATRVERDRAVKAEVAAKAGRDEAVAQKQHADEMVAVANAVNAFLNDDVLGQANPNNRVGPENPPNPNLTVREALDRAAANIGGRFPDRPQLETQLRRTVGRAYVQLGETSASEKQLTVALALARQAPGDNTHEIAALLHDLAYTYQCESRLPEAEKLYGEAIEAALKCVKCGPAHSRNYRCSLAGLYIVQGRFAEAGSIFEQRLEGDRKELGEDHPDTLTGLDSVGVAYDRQGRRAEAEALFKRALEGRRKVMGELHPYTLDSLRNLAQLYEKQPGREAEAEALHKQALAGRRKALGENHPDTLMSLNALACLYADQRRFAEAEPLFAQLLEKQRSLRGEEHRETLSAMFNMGTVYQEQGRAAESLPLLEAVLAGRRKVLGEDHPDTVKCRDRLIDLYLDDLGRRSDAEPLIAQQVEILRQEPDSKALKLAESLALLGANRVNQGKATEAEPPLREALDIFTGEAGDTWMRFAAESSLGVCLGNQQKDAEAEPLLLSAYKGLRDRAETMPRHAHTHIASSRGSLVHFYKTRARNDQAAWWRGDVLVDIRGDIAVMTSQIQKAPNDPKLYAARGRLQTRAGLFTEAATDFAKAIQKNPDRQLNWYYEGSLLAYLGREKAYREHCAQALKRFSGHGVDSTDAKRTARTCLLLPGAGDPVMLLAMIERAAPSAGDTSDLKSWYALAKSLALYRADEFQLCIDWADKCITADLPHRVAAAECLRVMAFHELGQPGPAQSALDRATVRIKKDLPQAGQRELEEHGIDWLVVHTLWRQAQRVSSVQPTPEPSGGR